MGNRRLAQAPISEKDSAPARGESKRKRKLIQFSDEDEEEDEIEDMKGTHRRKKGKEEEVEAEEEEEEEKSEEPEPDPPEEAQPVGSVVRVSGRGRGKRNHYESFEYNGHQYSLEDPALFHPENKNQKPYVAIIKDIAQTCDGELMVTGQWFYRPEEAEKRGGGNWQLIDTRELFYSFHRDEVPAESVFHKCVVHFIPLNKQIPARQKHPGFFVQKVYDTEQRRLFKLTDKDYEDNKLQEIDLLVQKTLARLGDLPDLAPDQDTDADHEDQLKNKRLFRRRSRSLLDVSKKDDGLNRSQSFKPETPVAAATNASEYYTILSEFKQLSGETQRDKWLEKLLQSVQFICTPKGSKQNDGQEAVGSDVRSPSKGGDSSKELQDKTTNDAISFDWPGAAVPAVAALEKAAHETLSADFQKYNQKLRQLAFNLKGNAALARRLLKGELKPAQILNMLPNELKEGLTAEEIASKEPEEAGRLQMTDARCTRCTEKQVGLIDIIQTGHGDRYQLECVACGNTWYTSRDDAAELTIEEPNSVKTVGTTPSATAKFEDVEKSLSSPRRAEKGSNDLPQQAPEANITELDNHKLEETHADGSAP